MTTTAPNEALAAMEIGVRLDRLRAALEGTGAEALLVTKLENIAYLTGFTGSAAMLLVTMNGALFTTDGRYRDQSAAQLAAADVSSELVVGRVPEQLEALAYATRSLVHLGLEADACSWSLMRRLSEALRPELIATSGVVERLRLVKDAGEIARIERACAIADVALAQVKGRLADKITEAEFAAELDFEMRRRGAAESSFETIVASGSNGALPHARPTNRPIAEGELVVVDFGATFEGYHSDMTRTLCVGEPGDEQARVVDAVLAAQRAGILALRAGTTGAKVDAACRELLADSGLADRFTHSTGHGVGLEIHEAPSVAIGSADNLPIGSVVTVEPGVYLPGRFGVRIEDTLVVTETGSRPLTRSTKDYTL